jgi:hypothetical protein
MTLSVSCCVFLIDKFRTTVRGKRLFVDYPPRVMIPSNIVTKQGSARLSTQDGRGLEMHNAEGETLGVAFEVPPHGLEPWTR